MQNIIYRMDKQQGPTVYTENYIQYPEINQNGKEHEKEYTKSFCSTAEINTLQINYTSIKNF